MLHKLLQKPAFLYCNVVLFFFLINGVCSRAACRLDLSRDQINSISESSVRVFQSLAEPVLMEAYISHEVTGEISSELQPILSILQEMGRIGRENLKLRIYNPNNEELRKKAQERGIRGLPITQQKDIEASVRLGYFGIYLQKGEDSTTIPLVDRNWFVRDLEYRILREIKRLGRGSEKSGIAILKAPGSPEIRAWTQIQDQNKDNFYGYKTTLEQELGAVEEIELSAPVPAAVQSLILLGLPRLEARESYYLDQFLMRGGNLLCMLSSFKFQIQAANPQLMQMGLSGGGSMGTAEVAKEDLEKLNAWLGKYGVTLNGEIILEPQQPMPVWDFHGRFPRQILYPAWAVYTRKAENISGDHPSLKSIQQLVFPWFSSLDIKAALQPEVKYQTLVQTSLRSISLSTLNLGYKEVQTASRTPDKYLGYRAPLAVLASGKFKTAYPQKDIPAGVDRALHLETQAEDTVSNLVVVGTPYLVSDIMLRNQSGGGIFKLNNAFLLNLLEAVEGDTDLLAARSRQRTISTLVVESKVVQNLISWSLSLGMPLVLGIWGAFRLTQRGRKRGLET